MFSAYIKISFCLIFSFNNVCVLNWYQPVGCFHEKILRFFPFNADVWSWGDANYPVNSGVLGSRLKQV